MPKTREPIEPILRDNILRLADACISVRKVKLTTLSGECHGDPQFLKKLKAKACSFSIRKYDSAMLWFDKWFEENWPRDIPRPEIIEPFHKSKKVPASRH